MIGQGTAHRLANPPRGVGAELVTAVVVELLDRPDEADVPFLDEVQERHPAADVFLGHRNNEPKVRFGQMPSRAFGFGHDLRIRLGAFIELELAALDLLRQVDFLLGREERDLADFPQIEPDGIVQVLAVHIDHGVVVGQHMGFFRDLGRPIGNNGIGPIRI